MKRKISKFLFLSFAIAALFTVLAFSSSAKEYVSGDFKFNVGSKNATVMEYNGKSTSVKIPATVKGVPITKIEAWAFSDNKKMTSISIPSTVTSIGEAAFNSCTSLTKIVLPKGLTKISPSAFWYCTALKKVVVYDKVTSIGKDAFRGCDKATIYVVKGSYAEKHVKNLTNVKLGYVYLSSLKLTKTSLTLQVAASEKLTYKVSPSVVYNSKVTYKSSNEKVATVSSDGKVKAVACGTAVITCTAADGSGKISSCTVKVVPQNVSGLKTTSVTTTSYKLTWNKSAGATSYIIKRYDTASKTWTTVTKTTKTSYTFKNLTPGTSARFAVKAYTTINKTNYTSPAYKYYTAKTLAPDKVSGLTAKAGSDSITLTWKAIDGATGYIVYVYDNATKEYYPKETVSTAKAVISSLQSATDYSFAVKAFYKSGDETSYSAYYSDLCNVTTLPGLVKGFAALEGYTTSNSLILTWTKVENCGGYMLYQYDETTAKYKRIQVIKSSDITMYEVSGLEPSTTYLFKIRAFGKTESDKGEATDKLKVTTLDKLVSKEEALTSFVEALNATKKSNGDLTIFKQCNIVDRTAQGSIDYADILGDVGSSYRQIYNIVGGKDVNTLLTVNEIISPLSKNCTLESSMISAESLTLKPDGEGYNISFELPLEGKEAEINSLIAETPDWQAIEEKYENFKLNYCVYERTSVEAKVKNGLLDTLTIKVPMNVSFTLGEKDYFFSQTLEYEYFFIRN